MLWFILMWRVARFAYCVFVGTVQAVSDGNHTSTDGRFMLELNDGNRWILYSSDVSMALYYVPAQPNEPNK